jgi:hypothetical protein
MSRFAGVSKKEFEILEKKVQKNREREELVNIINNKFSAIDHRYTSKYDLDGSWEMLLGFIETTVNERVIIHKNYNTGDIWVEVLRNEREDDGEEIEWEEDCLFSEKRGRICEKIEKMIGKNHQTDQ